MSYRNLSTLDRTVRLTLGLLMLTAGWFGLWGGVWSIALEVFGWVPLVTALSGWCPIYALLGLRTYRPRQETEDY
jgi:Protein of unknown function (DUF2892)